ncbi:MAG: cysteine--tRNA ligase [Planctomycetota bacterium]
MLVLYNTLTRLKEEFNSIEADLVKMYHCGPTVYSYAHIGNFRAFLFADLLRRYFQYKGYKVTQIMNITDVGHMTTDAGEGEDKLEAAAKREKKDPCQIARFYEESFLEDVDTLGILRAHKYPRATEHVSEMIEIIKKLLEKGVAYISGNAIYYDISKFPAYGRLSNNPLENLMAGARIDINLDKRNPFDFALWKSDAEHIMKWDSPWGEGYPGWHLECSAMSMKYLGESFDIHTGGEDNIFPHHECEIAQSESVTEKKFVNCWMHTRFLLVEGQKMAKSLGNFYTVKDLANMGYNGRTIRYALISTHYRTPLNFTFDGLKAAKAAIERLEDFRLSLETTKAQQDDPEIPKLLTGAIRKFEENMDDDLNISGALGVLFEFVREVNRRNPSKNQAGEILIALLKLDSVLSILSQKEESVDENIARLVAEREEARKQKNYSRADAVRKEIKKLGYALEDTPSGVRWKKL